MDTELAPSPSSALRPSPSAGSLAALRALADEAFDHDANSRSANTRRAYDSDWRQFTAWCERYEVTPLPVEPALVRLYVTDLASQVKDDGQPRFRASTIERHLASIGWHSRRAGGAGDIARDPLVASVVAGLRRSRAEKPRRQRPILLDTLTAVITAMEHDTFPNGIGAARDTLAFGLGFAAALRRSEVSGLTVRDLEPSPADGLYVHLGVTKTDQDGLGALLAVPYGTNPITCVPCARVRWLRLVTAPGVASRTRLLEATGPAARWQHVCRDSDAHGLGHAIKDAPLLCTVNKGGRLGTGAVSASALNSSLKKRLVTAGFDPAPYGFHSLRAGFVTQARRNGASTREVRRQTRHGSDAMVDLYDREHLPLRDNAVTTLGL
ncbi:hypothetical protein [Nocardioides yefusunii]|uniref:Integrase n=1 Tax=Nocardioides yefusunii TaxID=2500546 RepID=A0ABW1QSJ2_9ACTN|nr:hypothetical protein [Nocardioides yefusunii]